MKRNIIFIWGNDAFLIDIEIEKIISSVEEENRDKAEVVYLDADELGPVELMNNLEFSPLFSMQRVVVIKRPYWLGKTRQKSKKIEEFHKVLSDYITHDNQGQTLILTAEERNSGNQIVKLLSKKAEIINCKTASSQQLLKWIKNEFAARNCLVKPGAASLLAKSGQDMYYLRNLIEKVCLIVENRAVNENDIEEQLNNKEEIKVFKLIDALLDRNLKASFQAYNQLLAQGEHPIFFLYMIVRQFISLGKVKYCLEKGMGKKEIADVTGLKEFTIRKMMDNSRNFSSDEIRELFKSFLQTDISFKTTGKNQKVVMETLIIEICTKK